MLEYHIRVMEDHPACALSTHVDDSTLEGGPKSTAKNVALAARALDTARDCKSAGRRSRTARTASTSENPQANRIASNRPYLEAA